MVGEGEFLYEEEPGNRCVFLIERLIMYGQRQMKVRSKNLMSRKVQEKEMVKDNGQRICSKQKIGLDYNLNRDCKCVGRNNFGISCFAASYISSDMLLYIFFDVHRIMSVNREKARKFCSHSFIRDWDFKCVFNTFVRVNMGSICMGRLLGVGTKADGDVIDDDVFCIMAHSSRHIG